MDTINMLPFAIEAFGHNRRTHRDLDKLYQTQAWRFYNLAKKSEFYNHKMIIEGDIYREEYGKKALGILLHANETQDNNMVQEIVKIIKKGWPHIYSYIGKNDVVIFEELFKTRKIAKSDDDFNTEISIAYWLATMAGKKIADSEMNSFISMMMTKRLEFSEPNSKEVYSRRTFDPKLRHDIKILRERIYKEYGSLESYDDLFRPYEDSTLGRFGMAISFIFDSEKMSPGTLFNNINLTKKDTDEVLGTYIIEFGNKNVEEAVKILLPGVIIKGILKAYKQTKEHYFKNNKETMYLHVKNQEDIISSLQIENRVLNDKLKKIENEIGVMRKNAEIKHLDRIRELESTVVKLSDKLDEEKEKDMELAALREFLFSLDREVVPEVWKEIPDFSGIKGVVVGGHERWQKKMKTLLQNFVFVSSAGFDTRVLDGADIVFFYTQHLGHKLYYKMIAEVRKRNLPVGYLGSINEELALQEMWKTITNKIDKVCG